MTQPNLPGGNQGYQQFQGGGQFQGDSQFQQANQFQTADGSGLGAGQSQAAAQFAGNAPQPATTAPVGAFKYELGQPFAIPLSEDFIEVPRAMSRVWISLGLGAFFLIPVISSAAKLVGGKATTTDTVVLVICLILSLFLLFAAFVLANTKLTINATGFHISTGTARQHVPWPHSRTAFYASVSGREINPVKEATMPHTCNCLLVDGSGAHLLPGLVSSGTGTNAAESKLVAEINRIWAWGLAKGYTQVSPEYFPLSGVHALKEKQRQVQIARYQLQDF